ncbi:hypothetical protein [Alicyclobacillus macrosporangiidus]|jgi:rRNA maturation endonuclease Nob1|uniref:Uncharacterized protein n=1 Tax=Alicyclobacillus macrosporangiidus TaxID=392015 RepID=A0A1I7FTT9_9BACL|nr:hypothetical protein [Alicyclobacillus macrosporangiidus]SFU39629.1 hypothetical protein SAMN05421543_101453 [Alicyclobacillus macrosporangiidus]
MPIIKESPVHVVQVRAFCEECGGELKSTGFGWPDFPMKYEHICDGCGNRYMLEMVYPATEFGTVHRHAGAGRA